eukprot:10121289-Lingulodinium_polyedra.AAC.1
MGATIFWRAHGTRDRAINEPLRRRTIAATASLRNVLKSLHNGAVASTVRHRNGSQIARSRAPCAQQFLLYTCNVRTCDLQLLGCCLGAAYMLLGYCLGAVWACLRAACVLLECCLGAVCVLLACCFNAAWVLRGCCLGGA